MNRRPAVIVSGLAILVMVGVSAWAWPRIPDTAQVPIHWGIDGQPNGWAPKWVALLISPALAVVVTVILGIIPAIEPRRANLARSSDFYLSAWVGAVALLAIIHAVAIGLALGAAIDIARVIAILLGLFFLVIGNVLPKTRSNFLAGIRTPWTLTSERSWTVTHRIGGRGFVLIGALSLACGLLGLPAGVFLVLCLGGLLVLTAGLVVVSYRVWQQDPDRQTIGATGGDAEDGA